jgi:hypothetical protein
MKYLLLLLLFSCKPRILDNHDYVIINGEKTKIECDYKDDDFNYSNCKDEVGNFYSSVGLREGSLILTKEE